MIEDERWTILPATEKENYIKFHKTAFEEDLKHSEKNIFDFPRWSIISGYYCMHDITKLFPAERFNVKIASPEIHRKTIDALEHFVKDEKLKIHLLEMLNEAKEIFFSSQRLKERVLTALLIKGKQERGKAQYYSEDYSKSAKINAQKAEYFLEKIVKPYLKLLTGLMKYAD